MANFYGNDSDDFEDGNFTNFYGGDGADILKGLGGANQLYGGDESDVLAGGRADFLTPGDVSGTGTEEDPFILNGQVASGNDQLDGGDDADVIYGFDGDDVISGGEGNDGGVVLVQIYRYQGGLFGGDGNDTIYGGGGDDEIHGGLGQDEMYGGKDADTFFFESITEIGKGSTSDLIGDFRSKQGDVIDVSLIDANDIKGGNQKFKYIGDNDFTKAGQVSFHNGKLKFNTDSDSGAEAVLAVNTTKIEASDFVL